MKTRVVLIIAIAATALLVGGFFAMRHHENSRYLEGTTPAVKMISLQTAQAIEMVTGSSSITFGEAFKRFERALSDVDSKVLEVQSMNTPRQLASTSSAILEYAKSNQELIRQLESLMRKSLQVSTKFDWAKNMLQSAKEARGYNEYLWEAATKGEREANEALEAYKRDHQYVEGKVAAVIDSKGKLVATYPAEALIGDAVLSKLVSFSKKSRE